MEHTGADVNNHKVPHLLSLPREIQEQIYSHLVPQWSLAIFNSDEYFNLPDTVLLNRDNFKCTALSVIPGTELALTCKDTQLVVLRLQQRSFDGHLFCGNMRKMRREWPFKQWFSLIHSIYCVHCTGPLPGHFLSSFKGIRHVVIIDGLMPMNVVPWLCSGVDDIIQAVIEDMMHAAEVCLLDFLDEIRNYDTGSPNKFGFIGKYMVVELRSLCVTKSACNPRACEALVLYFTLKVDSGQVFIKQGTAQDSNTYLAYRSDENEDLRCKKLGLDCNVGPASKDVFFSPMDWVRTLDSQRARVKAIESQSRLGNVDRSMRKCRIYAQEAIDKLSESDEGLAMIPWTDWNKLSRPTTPDLD